MKIKTFQMKISCVRENENFVWKLGFSSDIKYKEGNNRPSSVNQIPLVHNPDKSGNECYTQENTNTWETQVCEYVLEKSKFHLLWSRTRRVESRV